MKQRKNIRVVFALIMSMLIASCSSIKEKRIVVASDGSGDFSTIHEAIQAVTSSEETTTIFIRNGVYREKLLVPVGKNNIHFLGENNQKTIITWDDYSGKGDINTFTSYTIQIVANDVLVENLTIENSEGLRGQAVALDVQGDRCTFKNCRILGNQDTIYAAGDQSRQYFKDCYIEGTTDFIFGSATAVFRDCLILCKKNSYITAASTPAGHPFGYVFLNCRIEATPEVTKVYLGRPWRDYARVVFMHCVLGDHIRPEGWHNWSKPWREETAFYAEYKNTGPGSDTSERVSWSCQLTDEQAQQYTEDNILGLNEWKLK